MALLACRLRLSLFLLLAVVVPLGLDGTPAVAQFGGGGGGGGFGGGGGGGFGGGGGGGGGNNGASGVVVDADGVLHRHWAPDNRGDLQRQRQESLARLPGDLAQPSKLRKVSLTRLERLVAEKIAAGSGPDDAMLHLAGLTRVEYVFCYPETGDIVLAGPAEPWAKVPSGRVLGVDSGRPVIELQDLVAALRVFPPNAHQHNGERNNSPLLYCSIDPTPEGLSRMQQFLMQFGRQATPNDTQFIVEQLQEALGPQIITVGGLPATTHFAQVMVEADYRMKLIGIGLEQPPIRLKSYVARANPAQVSRNALQRWYFVPEYDCVTVSQDSLAMQIEGEGVKLVGENEMVAMNGGRQQSRVINRASDAFVNAFTKSYPELAAVAPVYAQLRNCIDLAVAAAFLQQYDLYGQVGWQAATFGDESAYPIETYNAPQRVATAVNSLWKGRTLMTPVGGGVQLRPTDAFSAEHLRTDDKGAVQATRQQLDLSSLRPDQWWWN